MTELGHPFTLKTLTLGNRLVLAPITTNYGSSKGLVTQNILDFYTERSRHIGLVIVEATSVSATGRIVPKSLGLWNDGQIPGMTRLAKAIHRQGAQAVVQLNHSGPRCPPRKTGRHGFSPSGVAFRTDVEPIIMNTRDIDQLIDDFSRAAVRAATAGFDGVEIHGAHLYLLSQFLSPLTNTRPDRYGGDARGRATLAIEIVRAVRKKLGPDTPVFFRINAREKIVGGQSLDEAIVIGQLLADAGVDVFDVTLIAQGGWTQTDGKKLLTGSSALPKDQPSGANIALTVEFKKHTGRPVIAVGKFGMDQPALTAVENKGIELVAIGRQMICDPLTAQKILKGKRTDILACDECLGCFAAIRTADGLACRRNKNLPF